VALKILIADPDQEWGKKIEELLVGNSYEVDRVHCGKDAQIKIADSKYFYCILNLDIQNHPGSQVLKFIKSNNPSLQIILILENDKRITEKGWTDKDFEKLGAQHYLAKPFEPTELIDFLDGGQDMDQLIGNLKTNKEISGEENVSLGDEQFTKVKVNEFFSGAVVLFDVFVRLGSGKYIKILHSGDSFTPERVEKYKNEKKVEHFHFLTKDRKKYVKFCSHMVAKTLDSDKVSTETKLKFTKNAMEKLVEELYEGGLKPQTIDQSKQVCSNMYNLIKKDKKLYKSLRSLEAFDPDAYTHAYLTSLFASMIAKQFDWDSIATSETIVQGCLLHDIGKLKLPKELVEKRPADMSSEELVEYKKHPQYGVELVEKIRMISPSIKQIILQHHESCDGTGFPYGHRDNRLQTLSKIVFLANEFSHIIQHQKIVPMVALKELLKDPNSTARYNAQILEHFLKVFIDPEKIVAMAKAKNSVLKNSG